MTQRIKYNYKFSCYPDDMSKFETVTLPTFGLACIVVAVLSLIFFGVTNTLSILVAAFLFALGLAALGTWLVNRTRRKKDSLFKK